MAQLRESGTFDPDGTEWLDLQKTRSHNLSNSYTLTCDTTQLVLDIDSFNRIRPIPLDGDEEQLYKKRKERVLFQAAMDTIQKAMPVTRRERIWSSGAVGRCPDQQLQH